MFADAERSIAQVTLHPRRPAGPVLGRYQLASAATFIVSGRTAGGEPFATVALQFPDELLPDSVAVARDLRRHVDAAGASVSLFVMADTTFGSCCPDEVTARHYAADAIVHFGFACYSRSCGLPVHYNTPSWAPAATVAALAAACRELLATSPQVVVVAFPGAVDVAPVLGRCLGADFALAASGAWLSAQVPHGGGGGHGGGGPGGEVVLAEVTALPRPEAAAARPATEWCVNGASFPVCPRQAVVFWGPAAAPQLQQLLLVAAFNASAGGPDPADGLRLVPHLPDGDPGRDSPPPPPPPPHGQIAARLRQRMFNIETVRAAAAVGVVVASLSIAGFRETAERLRLVLRRHGKRAYLVFVGHLSPLKLGNFADSLDCFAVVACPNSRMAHFPAKSDELLKPLVSPMEVMLALGYGDFASPRSFSTHFDHVLAVAADAAADGGAADDSAADDGAASLVPRGSAALAAVGSGGALRRLQQRSYAGLEPRVGETAVQSELAPGRAGIARGYTTEGGEGLTEGQ